MTPEPPSQPASPEDRPALIAQRILTSALALERRVETFERRFREREDLPGAQLFVRVLRLTTEAIKGALIETSRNLDGSELPDPSTYSMPREDSHENDGGRIRSYVVPISQELEGIRELMRQFESELGKWIDLLFVTQGPTFDSLAEPFARLAKDIPNDEDVEILFRPLAASGYAISFKVTDNIAGIAQDLDVDLEEAFAALPRLMAIEYPLLQEEDTFQHACIAHELGHIAYYARRNEQRVGEQVWTDALIEARRTREDVPDRYASWFYELACDFFAVRLIGPAFPLALTEWVLAQNIWQHPVHSQATHTHPPMYWRLARLWSEVDRYLERAAADGATAWELTRSIVTRWRAVIPIPPAEVEENEDIALVETALESLAAQAPGLLGPVEYTPETFVTDLGPIWTKLDKGIAPAEAIYDRGDRPRPADGDRSSSPRWSEEFDWRSILNGGYLHWLARQAPHPPPHLLREAADRDRDRMRACRHIQGAIELAQLHRNMRHMRQDLAALELGERA